MTAVLWFAFGVALAVLLDRSITFAWHRASRPLPRIEAP